MRRGLAFLALACAAASAAAQPLTPSEAAGRMIYHEGRSPSGRPITAEVGMARAQVPGPVAACANCHGADGLGRPEGGVLPSPITWGELTKSYGHVHDDRRRHPAFDERSFARSVIEGLDPAGNRLEPAMPRVTLHADDMRDLIAYLKRLENDPDPGLSETAIRVGTVLPATGPLASAGQAMRDAVEAAFADVNAAGGIYGRQLELVSHPHAPQAEAAVAAARELVDRERVFALVSPLALGAEAGIAALAEERKVPVVGPFTLRGPDAPGGRYTFYLFSGLAEQAEVLVAYGLRDLALATTPLAIVHPEGAVHAAEAAAARCTAKGCAAPVRLAYRDGAFEAASLAARAREAGSGAVLFLGAAAELERFADAAARAGWFPTLLVPGTLGARAAASLPPRFADRLFLAYPTSPTARESGLEDEFAAFAARHGLATGLPAYSGYLSASLFVDALRRSGRALGRERLVATLEATTEYRTGLAHPLRYGPQRRIGALGGHVVVLGGEARGVRLESGWIALD